MTTEDEALRKALEPCPFCGATPHQGLAPTASCQLHGEPIQRYRVWCPHSCAMKDGVNKAQAITAWNTRQALSTAQQLPNQRFLPDGILALYATRSENIDRLDISTAPTDPSPDLRRNDGEEG